VNNSEANFAGNKRVDDPESVPVRHAATVMIVDDRPDLHVLMVQRTPHAVFGPSAWVFPGGRVDVEDADQLDHLTTGLTAADASAMLELDKNVDGRAWWFAGLRETAEEAGLVLGAPGVAPTVIDEVRDAVHADIGSFAAALTKADVRLDLAAMHEVARFITPLGPPRRYDTRFFLAQAPHGQTAQHDAEEIVQHRWLRPHDAIAAFDAGEFPLMSVTHRMLVSLARYPTVEPAMTVAGAHRPNQRVRVIDPDGQYLVVLPGDPGYETAELEIETGWIRI